MVNVLSPIVVVSLIIMSGCRSENDNLLEAIRQKNVEAVRKFIESGTDLEPASGMHDVNKPLAYAAAYGNLDIVRLLVDAGAHVNGQVAYGDVPLIKADEHNNDDIIKYLIKNGADVNVPNYFGVTPFIGFCGQGKMDLVRLAILHGGDINASFVAKVGDGTGRRNFSPLQAAVAHGQMEVVELLLARGADATAKDSEGRTPLELAESKDHEGISQLLREHMKSANDK